MKNASHVWFAARHACKVSSNSVRRLASGFTLIELMVGVGIVGILTSIAYPAYANAMLRGKRSEGRNAAAALLMQQERYYTQAGTYMTFAPGGVGSGGTTSAGSGVSIPFKTFSGDAVQGTSYLLGAAPCAVGTALSECVMVYARPQRSDPEVGDLQVTTSGVKDCTGTNRVACWR